MMFFIATIFILAPLRAQDEGQPLFKTGVADVRVDVQVTQGKDLVAGLGQDDFIVTDEGQPRTIVSFEHGDEPVNLLLLFDISESMQPFIDQIAQSAREALDHLRPADRVAIMVFARTTAVHQDFSDNLAESARQISSAMKDWDVGVTTNINSAIVDAAHYMAKHANPNGRRAILILTDNLATSFQLTDGQVIRELDKADTVLNAIVTGRAIRPNPLALGMFPNREGKDETPANVFHLAEETGGEWVKVGQASQTFGEMIQRIRSRYMLAYHAPESQPGTFRHISVKLSP
ncbi:MAG TPA: VWA domain-containing protein, partial [Bryobacteraceae bacterium]|nr:VWA domain-containing protein [Bryobacteraceae bacterium]